MAVRTAKGGKAEWGINGTTFVNIPDVRDWTLNPATEAKEYASSSTAGAKRRLEGTDDFTLTVNVYIDDAARIDLTSGLNIRSGEVGYFKLWEDTADFFIAPVYIDSVTYTTDIENGEIVAATIEASGNGALTYPT